ncbi:hypothetical protein BGX34_008409 [Mortierella sp. NVP85]|nr:hypothetical protein BGX34_008409 [Mortierella sp. NVP85]
MSALTSALMLRHAPVYLLVLFSTTANLLTLGAPVADVSDNNGHSLSNSHYRPNVSAPAAIAGAILIFTGLFLCFAATSRYSNKEYIFCLSGFLYNGCLIYIAMVNSGVRTSASLLAGPLFGGFLLGILRIAQAEEIGAGVLGPIAMHCFSLWLLGVTPSGLITSKTVQIVVMVILDTMGLMFGLIPSDRLAASISCSMIGAYTFFAGIDFFARTGYIELADSFMNSKSVFDGQDRSHGIHYMFVGLIILTAITGTVIQRIFGDEDFQLGSGDCD